MSEYSYEKRLVEHTDGTWADVSVVRFPSDELRFENIILSDHQTRMRDAAHLRYVKARFRGEAHPVIVVWGCLENDHAVTALFPELDNVTDAGEHLLSANSLINYTLRTLLGRGWLYWEAGDWQFNIPQQETKWQKRAEAILNWLKAENRLWLEAAPDYTVSKTDFKNFEPLLNAIPVGRVGFLRRVVQEQRHHIAFNTAYFLLEQDDFFSHHSALGEPYNLAVHYGHIIRPPLYRRATFWRAADDRWHTSLIGMEDMRFVFPHHLDWQFSFEVNPADETGIAVYTRYYGVDAHNTVIGHTPAAKDRIEFTIIDREIVSWKRGGNLTIPQNGMILSFASEALSQEHFENIINNRKLEYRFAAERFQGMQEAIQCGPLLIQHGEAVLSDDAFTQEQFWISRQQNDDYLIGVVPSDYPTDIDQTRAGRVAIGINEQQEIIVVVVSGVNTGYIFENTDSAGATLSELTTYLLEAGAVEAINLDGGGSSQLFFEGGLINRPGDRRGLSGVVYERMIPAAGIVARS